MFDVAVPRSRQLVGSRDEHDHAVTPRSDHRSLGRANHNRAVDRSTIGLHWSHEKGRRSNVFILVLRKNRHVAPLVSLETSDVAWGILS